MAKNIKLKIYAVLFSVFVVFDAGVFLASEEVNIINWRSFVHSGWVILAAAIMLATAFLKHKFLKYFGLVIYLIIFILSLINQFIPFNDVLNYYCMLFNLGLFSIYYFAIDW